MRIAIVCQSYPPMVSGAALLAELLAKGLAANGHDVLVLAASDKKEAYVTQDGRLQIARLRSFNNPLRAKQRGLLWPKREIARQLVAFQPDIIHLQEPLVAGWSALQSARKRNTPVVLTLMQLPWFVTKYLPDWPGVHRVVVRALWQYGRWFLEQCTAVVSLTHMTANEVEAKTGVQPFVIGAGTDLARFSPNGSCPEESSRLRKKYGLDLERPILLHVGRLDADKQVEGVIQAAAKVMETEACQLLVVGDGHCRQRLISLSRSLRIDEHCHFPGFVTADGDLPGLYRAASLFVTASEIETFGLVVLEAMASGLPVVAPRATCLHELVEDGRSGYLSCPGDELALAERMRLLLKDPKKAGRMGAVGRERAMRFTTDAVIYQHEKLYALLRSTEQEMVPLPNVVSLFVGFEERLGFDN